MAIYVRMQTFPKHSHTSFVALDSNVFATIRGPHCRGFDMEGRNHRGKEHSCLTFGTSEVDSVRSTLLRRCVVFRDVAMRTILVVVFNIEVAFELRIKMRLQA